MNVKISFSVPFDRIPTNIQKFVRSAATDLVEVEEALRYYECGDTGESLAKIDAVRKQLAQVDVLLRDCYNILDAYEKHNNGEEIPTEQGETNASTTN